MIVVSEIWLVPFVLVILALMGILIMTTRIHRTLIRHVGKETTDTDTPANALQERIQRVVDTTAEQRTRLASVIDLSAEAERKQRIADDLDRVTEIRKRTEQRG
ncbi:MAG: hypothetical protein LC793_08400 [Thermomicrobia bacterium]|nr:hypothetical protein [Thermomicrobia bacterium]